MTAAFLQPFLAPVAVWKSKASQQGFASLTQALSDLVTLREVTHRHLYANVFFCFCKFYGQRTKNIDGGLRPWVKDLNREVGSREEMKPEDFEN